MLGDEDFGPVAEDNLALIDADEKKIEVENQFMQDDAMVNYSVHGAAGFKNVFMDPRESGTYYGYHLKIPIFLVKLLQVRLFGRNRPK